MRRLMPGFAILLVGLVGAGVASAGPLAATRASQLVTLRPIPGAACAVGSGFLLDARILPDGSYEPFAIPNGQVLVLTGISWSTIGAVGEDSEISLRINPSGALVFHATAIVDSLNNGSGNVAVPGIVVRSGSQLCFENTSGAPAMIFDATAHGFLAADR